LTRRTPRQPLLWLDHRASRICGSSSKTAIQGTGQGVVGRSTISGHNSGRRFVGIRYTGPSVGIQQSTSHEFKDGKSTSPPNLGKHRKTWITGAEPAGAPSSSEFGIEDRRERPSFARKSKRPAPCGATPPPPSRRHKFPMATLSEGSSACRQMLHGTEHDDGGIRSPMIKIRSVAATGGKAARGSSAVRHVLTS